MASRLLLPRRHCQTLPTALAGLTRRTIHNRPALSSSSSRHFASPQSPRRTRQFRDGIKSFSSLAQDWDGDDDNEVSNKGDDGGDGGGGPPRPRIRTTVRLLPTRHSRTLPPRVCRPSRLRSEVESIFDAPVGSLIVYSKPESVTATLKSVEEEMADAYYASDAIVQRAEYVMRGLNARVSGKSFVARSLEKNTMAFEKREEDDVGGLVDGGGDGEIMAREDCFRAMLDLIERMAREGEAYDELRTRVRSQLTDLASSSTDDAEDSGSSSDSSSSSDDDSDSDNEGEEGLKEEEDDESFNQWAESMEQNMRRAKISDPRGNNEGMGVFASSKVGEDAAEGEGEEVSEEHYQFGADPGVTTHMYDLVLDALACLCQERYGAAVAADAVDLAELMPEDNPSPPELAKDILDHVLHRHWIDGGDIGLGGGGSEKNALGGVAQGIGVGAGTGAGALVNVISPNTNFDVRTCPTPMTFNAVLRIAANFNPAAHAEAAENARVLGGLAAGGVVNLEEEKVRLRDVTIDAALTTFSRMQYCVALTLRTLKNSAKSATSRSALKRQARMLAGNYKPKEQNKFVSGRNSATYSYLIQTVANCIPPSMSRGNMTFGLYHKGCVQEGVMDERLVRTMRGVGGYGEGNGEDILDGLVEGESGDGDGDGVLPPPPISNGPIFDQFMWKELGRGVDVALEKGRKLRQDRNYKLRRHVEWDDTY